MFTVALLQFKQAKPLIVYQWEEDQVLEELTRHFPQAQRAQLEYAWKEMIKNFKQDSVKVM
jgi:uncharacterized protein (DUF433 family)